MTYDDILADVDLHRAYRLGRIHASEEIAAMLDIIPFMNGKEKIQVVLAWCQGAESYHPELADEGT